MVKAKHNSLQQFMPELTESDVLSWGNSNLDSLIEMMGISSSVYLETDIKTFKFFKLCINNKRDDFVVGSNSLPCRMPIILVLPDINLIIFEV